jgi:hypothetical protein
LTGLGGWINNKAWGKDGRPPPAQVLTKPNPTQPSDRSIQANHYYYPHPQQPHHQQPVPHPQAHYGAPPPPPQAQGGAYAYTVPAASYGPPAPQAQPVYYAQPAPPVVQGGKIQVRGGR